MAVEFSDFLKLKWYYQLLIVVGVSGGLLALFWYQFLTPIETEVASKQDQLNQLNTQIAQAVQRQQELAEIRAEAEALEAQLEELQDVLPLERETDDIIREVEQAAQLSSLRVIRVSPRPIVDREVYSEWAWDYQVQGTYHNMGRFLDRIRQLPRIVNITGINMNAAGGGATTTIGATYTATTFVYREEEPAPAAD